MLAKCEASSIAPAQEAERTTLLRRLKLDLLGLPTSELLQHGTPRLVYGVRLASNVRDYLLGLDAKARYVFSDENPQASSDRIASWWEQRWLVRRAQRKEILERIEQHSLLHPIRHGARITVLADPDQPALFEQW